MMGVSLLTEAWCEWYYGNVCAPTHLVDRMTNDILRTYVTGDWRGNEVPEFYLQTSGLN